MNSSLKCSYINDSLESPLISHHFLKTLYASFLLEFHENDVRKIWDTLVPTVGGDIGLIDYYIELWREEGFTDAATAGSLLNSIESFLTLKGRDVHTFIVDSFRKFNNHLPVSSTTALKWSVPRLEALFSTPDLRTTTLELIEFFSMKIAPGFKHKLLSHTINPSTAFKSAIMLFADTRDPGLIQPADNLPPLPLKVFNAPLWVASIVRALPCSMGLLPYESMHILADSRPIETIIPHYVLSGGCLFIDNIEYGAEIDFDDFCRRHSICNTLPEYQIQARRVIEITREYRCPVSNHPVLIYGCAYGAPIVLYRLYYASSDDRPVSFLAQIIDNAAGSPTAAWQLASERHLLLLQNLTPEVHCIYHIIDESISVNNKHLLKQVPAKLLRYMLAAYRESGRTEFEYRELLLNSRIVFDVYAPNISIRVKRLAEILSQKCPYITIIRTSRGICKLGIACKLIFSEV